MGPAPPWTTIADIPAPAFAGFPILDILDNIQPHMHRDTEKSVSICLGQPTPILWSVVEHNAFQFYKHSGQSGHCYAERCRCSALDPDPPSDTDGTTKNPHSGDIRVPLSTIFYSFHNHSNTFG